MTAADKRQNLLTLLVVAGVATVQLLAYLLF
jgi:hypothetical protein